LTHTALDTAYATLHVRPGAPLPEVQRQYRSLVKKWHPDRFTGDSQGVAEATVMLQVVNRAYKTILGRRAPDAVVKAATTTPSSTRSFGAHLTKEQTEEIISAIRHSESLLAIGLDDDASGWPSRIVSAVIAIMYVATALFGDQLLGVLVYCAFSLSCIWFPHWMGRAGGHFNTPSPPRFVWLMGWIMLLIPIVAFSIWLIGMT
jgi:DnaJ domain